MKHVQSKIWMYTAYVAYDICDRDHHFLNRYKIEMNVLLKIEISWKLRANYVGDDHLLNLPTSIEF